VKYYHLAQCFSNVDGIDPLGSISMGKGVKKTKGSKQHKGAKMLND